MNEVTLFLNYIKNIKNYSDYTVLNYSKDLSVFIDFLDNKNINWNQINYQKIRGFLLFLDTKKYSNKTIARHISTLRSFFKYLLKENIVIENPVVLISNPKKEKKLPTFLYYNEIDEIINFSNEQSPKTIRDLLLLEMLYSTGIRVSELVNIKLSDISLNQIKVLGKGNIERLVYFGKPCKDKLDNYLDNSRNNLLKNKKSEYLYINHLGNKLTDRGVRSIIDEIILKSSLNQKISPHTLRHTFATHMLNEGADLKTVQELLGHKNISTTGIYTHISNEQLRNVYLKNHPRARK